MTRYALEIAYDGYPFCGWQVQPDAQKGVDDAGVPRTSIQERLESALFEITGARATVVASGRTDAGVHAIRQRAHFDLSGPARDPLRLLKGLNAKLPVEVRVLKVEEVPREFHARFSATRKEYAYYLSVGEPLPHLARYVWFLPKDPRVTLNLESMRAALQALLGEHDFSAFQGRRAGTESSVRRIYRASIRKVRANPGGGAPLVRVSLVGSGFLKQMVRSIVGTAVEVGLGKKSVTDFERLVTHPDRRGSGKTAPGRGLWLEKVWYS